MSRGSSSRRRGAPSAESRRLSRRRFMALLAGGTLAGGTLAGVPVRAVTLRNAPKRAPAARATPARSTTIEKGIAEQKASLAKQLKTLREFPLPPGSDPAFVFHPVSPRRMR